MVNSLFPHVVLRVIHNGQRGKKTGSIQGCQNYRV